jgi:predicted flavoprotein YhiN
MAADVLSAAGHSVLIADAMPSPARKFLMAGKSGLNLTKVGSGFLGAYGDIPASMVAALSAFGPDQVIEWANDLGQEVFIGSTGRVFPVVMKASPLAAGVAQAVGCPAGKVANAVALDGLGR